ncbi:hypothetical protein L9W73_17385 [Vibrio aestuarianus]|uniref:Uncharacterized protein n=1 Tax=Vibrio aestuarianus TaxID=28171 RepID=A0A9X4FP77_9VIBR|nr:hypothetical protein [Vibrio aestuarianus]MDE1359050.1 hypothetical protein [Vibrio aestuarianus]
MKPEEFVFLVEALSQISIIDSILGGVVGGVIGGLIVRILSNKNLSP